MSQSKGIKEVAYVDVGGGGHAHAARGGRMQPASWFDCAGGGQVVVERNIAYIGNMHNPHGTLIVDVSDPKHPKQLSSIKMPTGTHSHKVRVGGDIQEPKKIKHVNPAYPETAKRARAQGMVILECNISTEGRVTDVKVLRGVPLLDQAAIDAVRQWVYTPTLLNGTPVPVVMTVTVNFRLN